MRRVLIVKTSSMGDVVHALPAISDLARALPDTQVDWLVEQSFSSIPARHGHVHRVIPLQWRKWRKSLRDGATQQALRQCRDALRQKPYDVVLDLQGLVKSAAFACVAKGPRYGYDWSSAREPLASLFYGHRFAVSRQLHAVDRCRQLTAQALGYELPATAPDFGLVPEPGAWSPSGQPFAVLVPCASRPEKLWPEADWIAVGQRLREQGLEVAVFWGGPQEQERAQRIALACGGHVPPFLTVAQVIDTMAQAQLIVGLDTGMTHIAAATGRPTLGLYCDHEPGLAGVTGSGPVKSLGGRGQVPPLKDVLKVVNTWMK
jgi:heptosyltransferase-1